MTTLPILFTYLILSGSSINSTVYDFNGDGLIDPYRFINMGSRKFSNNNVLNKAIPFINNAKFSHDVRVFNIEDKVDAIIINKYQEKKINNVTDLYTFSGNANFKKNPGLLSGNGGFGETILFADFNNDGLNDFILPGYAIPGLSDCTMLFKNNGKLKFNGDYFKSSSGGSCQFSSFWQPEGGVLFDYGDNGLIDFFFNGNLYVNDDGKNFIRLAESIGIDYQFDEGISIFDYNNDGNLDLLILHPDNGLSLYKGDGLSYQKVDNSIFHDYISGLGQNGITVVDLNSDGYEDIIINNGSYVSNSTKILLNVNGQFFKSINDVPFNIKFTVGINNPAVADFDNDGSLDLYFTGLRSYIAFNDVMPAFNSIKIGIYGIDKRKVMSGRVVRLKGNNAIQARVVNGGGNYISQNEYELTIPLSEPCNKEVLISPFVRGGISTNFFIASNYRVDVIQNSHEINRYPNLSFSILNPVVQESCENYFKGSKEKNNFIINTGINKLDFSNGINSLLIELSQEPKNPPSFIINNFKIDSDEIIISSLGFNPSFTKSLVSDRYQYEFFINNISIAKINVDHEIDNRLFLKSSY